MRVECFKYPLAMAKRNYLNRRGNLTCQGQPPAWGLNVAILPQRPHNLMTENNRDKGAYRQSFRTTRKTVQGRIKPPEPIRSVILCFSESGDHGKTIENHLSFFCLGARRKQKSISWLHILRKRWFKLYGRKLNLLGSKRVLESQCILAAAVIRSILRNPWIFFVSEQKPSTYFCDCLCPTGDRSEKTVREKTYLELSKN